MLDTGGDGWQSATYKLYNSTSLAGTLEGTIAASGALGDGFEESDWICLVDGCYEIVVGGGSADSEIGFEFYDEVRDGIVALPLRCRNEIAVMYVDLLLCILRGSTGRRPLSRPECAVLRTPLRRAGRRVRPSDDRAEYLAPALAHPVVAAERASGATSDAAADTNPVAAPEPATNRVAVADADLSTYIAPEPLAHPRANSAAVEPADTTSVAAAQPLSHIRADPATVHSPNNAPHTATFPNSNDAAHPAPFSASDATPDATTNSAAVEPADTTTNAASEQVTDTIANDESNACPNHTAECCADANVVKCTECRANTPPDNTAERSSDPTTDSTAFTAADPSPNISPEPVADLPPDIAPDSFPDQRSITTPFSCAFARLRVVGAVHIPALVVRQWRGRVAGRAIRNLQLNTSK